jgi:uncharacterized protein (TIGR02231 family)
MRGALAASLVVVSVSAFAQAQPSQRPTRLDVTTRPSAVAVYADQATVTRSGTIDLPAGDSVLVLSGVPAGLLPDSVSARGRASAQVTIGAVELRQATFDARPFNQRRAALDAQVRELDDQLTAIDVRHNAAAAQQQMIERLAASFVDAQRRPPGPNEAPRPPIDPASWRAAWELVRDGTTETGEAVRRARLERRAVEERKAALQAEIASLGAPPARGALEIAVSVRTDAATSLALEVSYQVRNASWRPVYEARLDTANARLALRQEAVVTQSTGEDWGDVALTLSTARPSAGTQPPQLAPWRITLAPPPQARYRDAPAGAAAPAPPAMAQRGQGESDDRRADGANRREAQVENAALVTVGFAVEYQIPGTATVRSDGSERRVRIAELPTDVTMTAQAIPRLDRRAFLRAAFASPAQVPLLPGQVTLVLDGVQVGRAALPLLRPTEQTALAFGADDRIRVAYEPQPPRRNEAGNIISGRTALVTNEALIKVQSFHARPIEITVLDQLPVSTEEPLVVTLDNATQPPPTARDVDERPGVLAWTATYAPREERRIRFVYSVGAPRDGTVYGMR